MGTGVSPVDKDGHEQLNPELFTPGFVLQPGVSYRSSRTGAHEASPHCHAGGNQPYVPDSHHADPSTPAGCCRNRVPVHARYR